MGGETFLGCVALCKGIQILESGKFLLVESGIPLMIGIQNLSSTDKESGIYGVVSTIQDCLDSLTWGELDYYYLRHSWVSTLGRVNNVNNNNIFRFTTIGLYYICKLEILAKLRLRASISIRICDYRGKILKISCVRCNFVKFDIHFFWCYYRWFITSFALEKCTKECKIL